MSEYIEREALLDRVCAVKDKLQLDLDNLFEDGVRIGFENVEMEIENIPAADVRNVVRGNWRLYSPLTETYECDKCGYQVIDESFRTNYCPNCGADMRE